MSKQAPQFWLEWILASLQDGKHVEITAKGWSMWPTIKPGTILTIQKTPIEEVQVGDAIAFIRDTHFVVHRVEKINQQVPLKILTRGDANLRYDELVTAENYCGKVLNLVALRAPFLPERLFNHGWQFIQINLTRIKKILFQKKQDSI